MSTGTRGCYQISPDFSDKAADSIPDTRMSRTRQTRRSIMHELATVFLLCLASSLLSTVSGTNYPTNRACSAVNSTALAVTWTQASDVSVIGYHLDLVRSDGLKIEASISVELADRTYEAYTFFGLGTYGTYTLTIHAYFSSVSNGTDYTLTCLTDAWYPDIANFNFTCWGVSYTQITCTWDNVTSEYWNGILEGYQLQYVGYLNDAYNYVNITLADQTYTINGLSFDSWYVVQLRTFNQFGLSPFTSDPAKTLGFPVVNETKTRYFCYEAVPGTLEFGWEEMPCTYYVGTILVLLLLTLLLLMICICQCCCKGSNKSNNNVEVNIFNEEKEEDYDDEEDNYDEDEDEDEEKQNISVSDTSEDPADDDDDSDNGKGKEKVKDNKSESEKDTDTEENEEKQGKASRSESAGSTQTDTDYASGTDSDETDGDDTKLKKVGIVNAVNKSGKSQNKEKAKPLEKKSRISEEKPTKNIQKNKAEPNDKKGKGNLKDNTTKTKEKGKKKVKGSDDDDYDSDSTDYYEDWNPDAEKNPDVDTMKVSTDKTETTAANSASADKGTGSNSKDIKSQKRKTRQNKRNDGDSKASKSDGDKKGDLQKDSVATSQNTKETGKQIKQTEEDDMTSEISTEESDEDSDFDESDNSSSGYQSKSESKAATKKVHKSQTNTGNDDDWVESGNQSNKVRNENLITEENDDDWGESKYPSNSKSSTMKKGVPNLPSKEQSGKQGKKKVGFFGKLLGNSEDKSDRDVKSKNSGGGGLSHQNSSFKGKDTSALDCGDWDDDDDWAYSKQVKTGGASNEQKGHTLNKLNETYQNSSGVPHNDIGNDGLGGEHIYLNKNDGNTGAHQTIYVNNTNDADGYPIQSSHHAHTHSGGVVNQNHTFEGLQSNQPLNNRHPLNANVDGGGLFNENINHPTAGRIPTPPGYGRNPDSTYYPLPGNTRANIPAGFGRNPGGTIYRLPSFTDQTAKADNRQLRQQANAHMIFPNEFKPPGVHANDRSQLDAPPYSMNNGGRGQLNSIARSKDDRNKFNNLFDSTARKKAANKRKFNSNYNSNVASKTNKKMHPRHQEYGDGDNLFASKSDTLESDQNEFAGETQNKGLQRSENENIQNRGTFNRRSLQSSGGNMVNNLSVPGGGNMANLNGSSGGHMANNSNGPGGGNMANNLSGSGGANMANLSGSSGGSMANSLSGPGVGNMANTLNGSGGRNMTNLSGSNDGSMAYNSSGPGGGNMANNLVGNRGGNMANGLGGNRGGRMANDWRGPGDGNTANDSSGHRDVNIANGLNGPGGGNMANNLNGPKGGYIANGLTGPSGGNMANTLGGNRGRNMANGLNGPGDGNMANTLGGNRGRNMADGLSGPGGGNMTNNSSGPGGGNMTNNSGRNMADGLSGPGGGNMTNNSSGPGGGNMINTSGRNMADGLSGPGGGNMTNNSSGPGGGNMINTSGRNMADGLSGPGGGNMTNNSGRNMADGLSGPGGGNMTNNSSGPGGGNIGNTLGGNRGGNTANSLSGPSGGNMSNTLSGSSGGGMATKSSGPGGGNKNNKWSGPSNGNDISSQQQSSLEKPVGKKPFVSFRNNDNQGKTGTGQPTGSPSGIVPLNDKAGLSNNKGTQQGTVPGNQQPQAWTENTNAPDVSKGGKRGGTKTPVQELKATEQVPLKEAEPVFETDRLGKKFPFLRLPDQNATESGNPVSSNKNGSKPKLVLRGRDMVPAGEPSKKDFPPMPNTLSDEQAGASTSGEPGMSVDTRNKVFYGFGVGRWRLVAAKWLNKWKMKKRPVKTARSSWD